LNVHGVNDVRQTELQKAELLVHEPSSLWVEIAKENQKHCKSPGTDEFPTELIHTGDNTF
jgi:hypothetical protein